MGNHFDTLECCTARDHECEIEVLTARSNGTTPRYARAATSDAQDKDEWLALVDVPTEFGKEDADGGAVPVEASSPSKSVTFEHAQENASTASPTDPMTQDLSPSSSAMTPMKSSSIRDLTEEYTTEVSPEAISPARLVPIVTAHGKEWSEDSWEGWQPPNDGLFNFDDQDNFKAVTRKGKGFLEKARAKAAWKLAEGKGCLEVGKGKVKLGGA